MKCQFCKIDEATDAVMDQYGGRVDLCKDCMCSFVFARDSKSGKIDTKSIIKDVINKRNSFRKKPRKRKNDR